MSMLNIMMTTKHIEPVCLCKALYILLMTMLYEFVAIEIQLMLMLTKELICENVLGDGALLWIQHSVAIQVKSLRKRVVFLADPSIAINVVRWMWQTRQPNALHELRSCATVGEIVYCGIQKHRSQRLLATASRSRECIVWTKRIQLMALFITGCTAFLFAKSSENLFLNGKTILLE